jgi:hypothetical protein
VRESGVKHHSRVREIGVRVRGFNDDESAVQASREDRSGKPALVVPGPDPLPETFFIGCFAFDSTGVKVHGRPTFQETIAAATLACGSPLSPGSRRRTL